MKIACLMFSISLGAQTAAELATAGARYLESNRPVEAQAAYEQSVRLDPANFEALSGLGFLL
jgi:cytochrome c-type biogenesis protein CcmH/NrfG